MAARATAPSVRLAPLALDHLPHVMTWVNDREVMQYFATRQTAITETEERAYLADLLRSKNDRAFSIFADAPAAGDAPTDPTGGGADVGSYVGQCSINQIYWPARNGRVFLVVRREEQGKGYGTEALRQLVERAWSELDLHKLWLIVRRDNKAAQAMYLRLGFEFEGVLYDEYKVGDRYFDMVRMGIVRTPQPR